MASQTQYLEWHGRQYRVRVKVPAKLRQFVGKGKLTHPLHTADLKVANERKWGHVARLKSKLAEYERAGASSDPHEAEALLLRMSPDDEDTAYVVDIRAEEIEKQQGLGRARSFVGVALGTITPLRLHADAFAAHQGYRLKSAGDFMRALGWLEDWLRDSELPVAVESVSRVQAGRFIGGSLVVGRSRSKAQAYLGFLRQYWKWLLEKGHAAISDNPWAGQTTPAAPRRSRDAEPDGGKRPFTDDEVRALLNGGGGPLLSDLMHIAALSGMRLEEICQLKVTDCKDGIFNIWAGKTDSAKREVPIHTGLVAIVKARSADKVPSDYLFHDLPQTPTSRETRSDPAAKRFTRYRRSVGVDDRPNGKAKSNVDFHSFRRWFIRKVRDARLAGATEFDEWTLTWVVGHTDSDRPKSLELSQRGYAGVDPNVAKRRLVEAVRLPE